MPSATSSVPGKAAILFLDAKRITSILGCTVYYADAYAGWQKGAVENFNKLVRRFYPKSTDFSKLTPGEIRLLQWKLTHYPRPSDNYRAFLSIPA